jgi:hypothetical protein
MTTITRHLAPALRVVSWLALAIAIVAAPAWAILENPGSASATPTVSTQPYGATPSEQEVSTYDGSHKYLWVEPQPYGSGTVYVPHADSSMHQY